MAMHDPFLLRRRDILTAAAATFAAGACSAAPAGGVSLFDYLPAGEQARIAAGTSDLDCAPILDRAIGEAIAADAPLVVPRGTYLLVPWHRLIHADRTFECLAAVRMRSKLRITGEAGAVLSIVPGFSSDRRPRAAVMFGADAPLADFELTGLTLDMNGRANPISPGRRRRDFSRLPQAQIFVSSPVGRPAARVDRARIADVTFRDANGVSCIVMAQTDDPAATLGRGWTIERCVFDQNGLDTDDHSSIFAWAEDVVIDRCRFGNAKPFDGTGVNTAIEVHGARQRITRSTFGSMLRGIWVANNYSAVTTGTVIADNEFRTQFYGVDFFHDRPNARRIVDTRIENNRFAFDDRTIATLPRLDMKAAVQIASEFGQQGIRATGNRVTKIGDRVTSAFLVVTGGASGAQRHTDIVATGNEGSGLTFGSFVRTSATAGLGTLTITDNRWQDLTPSATMGIAAGDAIERTGTPQPIAALTLGGGEIRDGRARRRTTHGVFLNARVDRLSLKPIRSEASRDLELGGAAIVSRRAGALR